MQSFTLYTAGSLNVQWWALDHGIYQRCPEEPTADLHKNWDKLKKLIYLKNQDEIWNKILQMRIEMRHLVLSILSLSVTGAVPSPDMQFWKASYSGVSVWLGVTQDRGEGGMFDRELSVDALFAGWYSDSSFISMTLDIDSRNPFVVMDFAQTNNHNPNLLLGTTADSFLLKLMRNLKDEFGLSLKM